MSTLTVSTQQKLTLLNREWGQLGYCEQTRETNGASTGLDGNQRTADQSAFKRDLAVSRDIQAVDLSGLDFMSSLPYRECCFGQKDTRDRIPCPRLSFLYDSPNGALCEARFLCLAEQAIYVAVGMPLKSTTRLSQNRGTTFSVHDCSKVVQYLEVSFPH